LYFKNLPFQISQLNIRGCEPIPGEFIGSTYETTMTKSLINCLINYYERVYADIGYKFYSGCKQQDKHAIFVSPSIICASTLQIADERFGSQMCRSDLSANAMVAFLDNEDNTEYWPTTIQYFLKHSVVLPQGNTEHILAMVDWYGKHSKKDHFDISRQGLSKTFNGVVKNGMKHVELWKPSTRKLSHENIIPIQRIVCRFMKSNYCPQNARTNSIAVIPLNRRFFF